MPPSSTTLTTSTTPAISSTSSTSEDLKNTGSAEPNKFKIGIFYLGMKYKNYYCYVDLKKGTITDIPPELDE